MVYEIQLPKSMVVVFVALSSSLWFTTALLLSGAVYGENEAGRLSLQVIGQLGKYWPLIGRYLILTRTIFTCVGPDVRGDRHQLNSSNCSSNIVDL